MPAWPKITSAIAYGGEQLLDLLYRLSNFVMPDGMDDDSDEPQWEDDVLFRLDDHFQPSINWLPVSLPAQDGSSQPSSAKPSAPEANSSTADSSKASS
ncbi:hypothetical protein ONZ43_g7322 [Nemania bipapillata]|uniref:Uncharacterized protein n=1 Tax=Nemania bipapillata TaxID=110536 RepID=A0ACC2HS68_9PEZI|nr:hypothetical protein ONZ43_g7322 [Nemania bipapillata]